MKKATFFFSVLFATVFLLSSTLVGQIRPKNAGISVRGTYWGMQDEDAIVIRSWPRRTNINIGRGGVWLNFTSRMNEYTFVDFSLGAVGQVESEEVTDQGDRTQISAVIPVVLGFRYNLFHPGNQGALQPYLSFGGGPYWLSDIVVLEHFADHGEEITVSTNMVGGGYAGGGINFMLASSFGLNFDVRHHFIEFDKHHEYSGFEYGIGLLVQWGDYRPKRRSRRRY